MSGLTYTRLACPFCRRPVAMRVLRRVLRRVRRLRVYRLRALHRRRVPRRRRHRRRVRRRAPHLVPVPHLHCPRVWRLSRKPWLPAKSRMQSRRRSRLLTRGTSCLVIT